MLAPLAWIVSASCQDAYIRMSGNNEVMNTSGPYRIEMVCTGNICRSVMAQIVLDTQLRSAGTQGVIVSSSGISDEEHGNPIDRRAAKALRQAGYPTPLHRAHQLDANTFASSDLVLAMTSTHFARLEQLAREAGLEAYPGASGPGRVDLRMFRSFDPNLAVSPAERGEGDPFADAEPEGDAQWLRRRELDVPDPWYGTAADFDQTMQTVEEICPHIVSYVRKVTNQ